ncbi:DNA/RNA non-specific endonuclease [Pseudoflavonifractor phocaeensis]|uniref:DNA/RNA non-specific endonuclease n=1 Tax=Pseudoflavonifractor phocaeensis TaxID=1870988 RepID=UPI001957EB7E|nr:DNA/RNA non-specific endonuclease [Pseudoflavonifractor phocaeensis]MBM6722540.1 DNA/RNA non-specific endonuclease [Pseudoflavonifractor phocaeensis]
MDRFKMRRFAAIILSLVTVFSIVGCVAEPTRSSWPTPASEQTQSVELGGAQTGTFLDGSVVDVEEFQADTPWIVLNGNIPEFTEADLTTEAFETYSELDSLGRCGVAYANVGQELMPTEDRESISEVKPSGWINKDYGDLVDGGYLYNRCHLIGFQLTGENANERNLITGTRYMNIEGMLPFENMVADYVDETGNHVLYRVTPIYEGDDLVATGVQMEGYSVEDNGEGICYNIFAYNSQPGIAIDYATGDSWLDDSVGAVEGKTSTIITTEEPAVMEYVLNTNSMKFHYPDCSSVADMSAKNREDYTGTREDLLAQGYSPCGVCFPNTKPCCFS